MGIFSKFGFGLKKTREGMTERIEDVLGAYEEITDDFFDDLEEALIMGDIGMKTAVDIVSELRHRVNKNEVRNPKHAKMIISEIIAEMIDGGEDMGLITMPSIILVIGVNGVGKTTTIGKLAAMYKKQGKKVVLGAADTFRAAAIEQLEIWADRAGVDIVKHKEGADPAWRENKDENTIFQGAIDLLAIGEDGDAQIIDYKYSKKDAEYLAEHYRLQLALYRQAAAKILKLDEKRVRCSIVNIYHGFQVDI